MSLHGCGESGGGDVATGSGGAGGGSNELPDRMYVVRPCSGVVLSVPPFM